MQPRRTVHPEFTPFVTYRLFSAALLLAPLLAAAHLVLTQTSTPAWPAYAIAIILFLFFAASRYAQHKKTVTHFHKKRIVHKTGGLVTNQQTTLNITNITHVAHKKPWLEHKLFSTSNLRIETAGSGATEAHLRSISESTALYSYVQQAMQENGFSLTKKQLLQEENPSLAAVILKTLGAGALVVIFAGPGALLALLATIITQPLLLIPAAIGALLIIWFVLLHILDHTRRAYRVYSDCIDYQEGFLTTTDSIIPAENLAESHNKQNLLDRIVGTSNIELSTQGTGTITFSNMPRGEALEDTIDALAKRYEPLTRVGAQASTDGQPTKTRPKSKTAHTSSHQQHLPRALASSGLALLAAVIGLLAATAITARYEAAAPLLAIGAWALVGVVFMAATAALQALRTNYEVRKSGVYEHYSFIKRTTHEFTDDKLVGLQITQNPLDRIFDTASISFQSLSEAPNITFKHLRGHQELLGALQKKYYLDTSHQRTIHANYKIRYAASRYALLLTPLVIAFAVAALAWPPTLLLAAAVTLLVTGAAALRHLTYTNSTLELHDEHVRHHVGYFKTTTTLVRYEDIKSQAATHYRLTPVGGLYLDVGGRNLQQQGNQQTTQPNGFLADYLPHAQQELDAIDQELTGHQPTTPLKTARRDWANHIITHTLIPPLLLILPVTLWRTSKWRYELQEHRIHEHYGVWNTRTRTVAYRNIDHVNEHRGFTNKLAKNGSVNVQTLGAGLTIKNISDYQQWREAIEKRYR